jgi:hypothetical protein
MCGETSRFSIVHFRLVTHGFAGLGGRSRLHACDSAKAQESDGDDKGLAHFHFLFRLFLPRCIDRCAD